MLTAFESGMPMVGLLLGRGLASAVGGTADDVAGGALVLLGAWVLLRRDEEDPSRLGRAGGFALIALGFVVSLDELAIGLTIGLLRLSIVLAVILIAVQAFAVAQLGLALGARVGERSREWAERLGGAALVGLGVLFLAG